jgi:hypothetical protein
MTITILAFPFAMATMAEFLSIAMPDANTVIDALRSRGLWANGDHSYDRVIAPERQQRAERDAAGAAELAERIWREGIDPLGTIAENYLQSRKLRLPSELRVIVLRFHP